MRLVVDLSNKSAQLLDPIGRCIAMWSGVTRKYALSEARAAGWWQLTEWELTSPPDGFYCEVGRRPHPDGWPSAEEIDKGPHQEYVSVVHYQDGDTVRVVHTNTVMAIEYARPLYIRQTVYPGRLVVSLVDFEGKSYAACSTALTPPSPPEPTGLLAELLAAIAECETNAEEAIATDERGPWQFMLDSCAASRELIGQHNPNPYRDCSSGGFYCSSCGSGEPYEYPTDWPCNVIMAECKRYAINPDQENHNDDH